MSHKKQNVRGVGNTNGCLKNFDVLDTNVHSMRHRLYLYIIIIYLGCMLLNDLNIFIEVTVPVSKVMVNLTLFKKKMATAQTATSAGIVVKQSYHCSYETIKLLVFFPIRR
jgi:hypothetical protein